MGSGSAEITQDVVRKLASLAKLELSPGQIETLSSELAAILDYMKVLHELSLDDAAPLSGFGSAARLSPDDPRPGLDPALSTREAKRVIEGHFAVPQVVDLTKRETPPGGRGDEG